MMLVGECLKQEREKRDLTVFDLSKKLNISRSYINSIENNSFSNMPGKAYTIGYIRMYANYFKLDSDKIVNQYKIQISSTNDSELIKTPQPLDVFNLFPYFRFASIFVIFSVSSVFFYMFIYQSNFKNNYAITSNIPENLESSIEQYEVDSALAKLKNSNKNKSNKFLTDIYFSEDEEKNINRSTTVFASKPIQTSINSFKDLISIKVLDSTWIQVRDINNNVIYSKLMKVNDIYNYSLIDNYKITSGNAGNVIVTIGDQVMGKLGKKGEIIDSISITPDIFSD